MEQIPDDPIIASMLPHRLAALDADRGRRRRWHGSGLSNRSCRTASFTA